MKKVEKYFKINMAMQFIVPPIIKQQKKLCNNTTYVQFMLLSSNVDFVKSQHCF